MLKIGKNMVITDFFEESNLFSSTVALGDDSTTQQIKMF